MFNHTIDKIKQFNKDHPYLMAIIIFMTASLIGIALQYMIDGRIIKTGFYTAVFILIVRIISIRRQQKKNADK